MNKEQLAERVEELCRQNRLGLLTESDFNEDMVRLLLAYVSAG